jgi:hypothetical protein
MLESHPNSVFASLWPRKPTIRAVQITTNLEKCALEFTTLGEVTDRLIGCYAGKAAEFLFLQKFATGKTKTYHLSTLGLEEVMFAQKLIYAILEKWYFYSKKSPLQRIMLPLNRNVEEYSKRPQNLQKLEIYADLLEPIDRQN